MKTIVKLGLVGLTLAASSAYADVALPSTGNGELTLFVRNETTGAVYARGLQVRLDDILTQAHIDAGFAGDTSTGLAEQLNYALPTIGPDANLTTFLSAGGAAGFTWTIMAGDSSGSANAVGDARRYLTTVSPSNAFSVDNPNAVSNNDLTTFSQLGTVQNTLNGVIDGTSGAAGDGHSTAVNGQWRQTGTVPGEIAGNWFGAGPDTTNVLNQAASLFVLTSGGNGGLGTSRTYQGLDVILSSNGTLSAVGVVPSVPLPPAVFMLASGLLTLAGVGRRRKDQGSTPVAA